MSGVFVVLFLAGFAWWFVVKVSPSDPGPQEDISPEQEGAVAS